MKLVYKTANYTSKDELSITKKHESSILPTSWPVTLLKNTRKVFMFQYDHIRAGMSSRSGPSMKTQKILKRKQKCGIWMQRQSVSLFQLSDLIHILVDHEATWQQYLWQKRSHQRQYLKKLTCPNIDNFLLMQNINIKTTTKYKKNTDTLQEDIIF